MIDERNVQTDALIRRVLRHRARDPRPTLVDDILRAAETMPQDRRLLSFGPMRLSPLGLLALIALLASLAGTVALGSRLLAPDTSPPLPAVFDLVDAVNANDVSAVLAVLADDATIVVPQIDSSGVRDPGQVALSPAMDSAVGSWLEVAAIWGMELDVESCTAPGDSVAICDIATRWHTLDLESVERWTIFVDGPAVRRLEIVRIEREPTAPRLPLRYSDLSAWETWLAEAHPADFERLAGSYLIANFYFRYAPDQASRVAQLIDEYLEARP